MASHQAALLAIIDAHVSAAAAAAAANMDAMFEALLRQVPSITSVVADQHALISLSVRRALHARLGDDQEHTAYLHLLELFVAASLRVVRSDRGVDATLPLLVMEDAFEVLPLPCCEHAWGIFEAHKGGISARCDEQRYRMVILRICSGLTRRLSRAVNTVFLGRILITVASMFALTERSGVNVTGFFDADNVTQYSGGEEDAALAKLVAEAPAVPPVGSTVSGKAGGKQGAAALAVEADAGIRRLVAPSKSALRTAGAVEHVLDAVKEVDEGKPFQVKITQADGGAAEGAICTAPAFFRTFWRLQSYMIDETRAVASHEAWALFVATVCVVLRAIGAINSPTTAAAAAAPASATAATPARSAPAVEEEEEGEAAATPAAASRVAPRTAAPAAAAAAPAPPARYVPVSAGPLFAATPDTHPLPFARAFPFSASTRKRVMIPVIAPPPGANTVHMDAQEGADDTVVGLKYLTNEKLLGLEMADPDLRRHVVLQILILLQHYAEIKADVDAAAAPAPAAAAPSRGGGAAQPATAVKAATASAPTASATQATPPAAAAAAAAAAKKQRVQFPAGPDISEDIALMARACFRLLRASQPQGDAFAAIVAVLLSRDTYWRRWKNTGAQGFERAPVTIAAPVDNESGIAAAGVKRRAAEAAGGDDAQRKPFKRARGGAPTRPMDWASAGMEHDLWETCQNPSQHAARDVDAFMTPMLDALDPDNGIEEEYWPSKDPVFVWRACRMLASDRLRVLGDTLQAPFLKVVCNLYNIQRPDLFAAPPAPAVGDEPETKRSTSDITMSTDAVLSMLAGQPSTVSASPTASPDASAANGGDASPPTASDVPVDAAAEGAEAADDVAIVVDAAELPAANADDDDDMHQVDAEAPVTVTVADDEL